MFVFFSNLFANFKVVFRVMQELHFISLKFNYKIHSNSILNKILPFKVL